MDSIEISTGSSRLLLSRRNGALLSLLADGAERIEPAKELFTLRLLEDDGEAIDLSSSDFVFSVVGGTSSRLRGRFTRAAAPTLVVEVEVRGEGDSFFFRPSVLAIPNGLRLEWIDLPHVNINNAGRLYWPFYDGCEVSDFACREDPLSWNDYRPIGYTPRRKAWGALYPGHSQMQFLAYYRNRKGLYFAAVDPAHTQKATEFDYLDETTTRLSLQTFCGEAEGDSYRSSFEYVLRPYDGEWREACSIYRDWIRTLPAFRRSIARPAWMADSPVSLIYPVQGEGIDHGPMGPNDFFPYLKGLPHVETYAKAFDSRILALLMHWEGTAPWAPPYVWPPLGGEEPLAAFRDALHDRGHLLGLYCSGSAWTQRSCINGYSREAECREKGLERHMMRGPKGELEATICNAEEAQRFGYDMCLADPWSRDTLCGEALKIARAGVDYCQLFDQNIGGGALLCYAKDHGHPPVPGAWSTAAMGSLQERIVREARQAGSGMVIGCEGCAATPYVGNLFFNDSRPGSDIAFGRSVPGMSFVFHEWMCNFSGNQIGHDSDLLYRLARSFHYGDMLSAVMGRDGKLVHAWGLPWDHPLPPQEATIALIRSLNALRKRFPRFLLEGRMAMPFVAVEAPPAEVRLGERTIPVEGVLASFWEDAAGERLGFVTNWQGHPVTAEVTGERGTCPVTLGAGETVLLHRDGYPIL